MSITNFIVIMTMNIVIVVVVISIRDMSITWFLIGARTLALRKKTFSSRWCNIILKRMLL